MQKEYSEALTEALSEPEWIRPSPASEKAWRIAAWIICIIATILFVGCGVLFCILPEGGNSNPKVVVFFLIPIGFWFMLRVKDEPPILGVRIAHGDALQVKMDDGLILTITYEKLADMWQIARLRENGRYFLPRTDGYYVGWRGGGPQLSRHDIGRLGVSGKSYFNDE